MATKSKILSVSFIGSIIPKYFDGISSDGNEITFSEYKNKAHIFTPTETLKAMNTANIILNQDSIVRSVEIINIVDNVNTLDVVIDKIKIG